MLKEKAIDTAIRSWVAGSATMRGHTASTRVSAPHMADEIAMT